MAYLQVHPRSRRIQLLGNSSHPPTVCVTCHIIACRQRNGTLTFFEKSKGENLKCKSNSSSNPSPQSSRQLTAIIHSSWQSKSQDGRTKVCSYSSKRTNERSMPNQAIDCDSGSKRRYPMPASICYKMLATSQNYQLLVIVMHRQIQISIGLLKEDMMFNI